MSNTIRGAVEIVGPIDQIEQCLQGLRGKNDFGNPLLMDLNAVVPCPDELMWEEEVLEWRKANWGTVRYPEEVTIIRKYPENSVRLMRELAGEPIEKGEALVQHITSGSPAVYVIRKLARMFPELEFAYHYHEILDGFTGVLKWKYGDCMWEEYYQGEMLDRLPDSFWKGHRSTIYGRPSDFSGAQMEHDGWLDHLPEEERRRYYEQRVIPHP